jgi:hypothetical protein
VAFWSALRRWAERAVAAGALTVDHVKSGDPVACTLLSSGTSPSPVREPQKSAPIAPAERPDEAAELLDDLLIVLLDLSGDEWDAWIDVVAALPDELYDRIDQYIEKCLQES